MATTGLILAAHGSLTEPLVNQQVEALAGHIAGRGLLREVRCGFHLGTPSFSEVVDEMTADEIVVVPLMASDGYYATAVLPVALASAERFGEVPMRQTCAVGAHPRIPDIVSDRCRALMTRFDCEPNATSVMLIGHGTPRHRDSRHTTQRCADHLTRQGIAAEVLPAFLEDQPSVEEAMAATRHADVIVIPFMIGFGRHVTRDLARRLELGTDADTRLPVVARLRQHRIVLDAPVGVDPALVELIIDLALNPIAEESEVSP